MSRTACGRADLIRLLAAGGEAEFERLARVLGYEPRPEDVVLKVASAVHRLSSDQVQIEVPTSSAELEIEAKPLDEARFWHLARFEPVGEDVARRIARADQGSVELPCWTTDPGQQPALAELSAWRDLVPRLRGTLAEPAETRLPDVPAIVRQLCRGRTCTRLPRRRRRQWGRYLTVVEDRSDRLIPYWEDQARVAARLADLYPRHAFRHAVIWESVDEPVAADPNGQADAIWPPPPGSQVVVLGDLGCLVSGDRRQGDFWARLGAELGDLHCHRVALTPIGQDACAPGVRAVWDVLTWERGAAQSGAGLLRDAVERLLTALSPASRIEPGLLRDLRRLLDLPVAVESLVWQHRALSSRSSVAATLRAGPARELRAAFEGWDPEDQEKVLRRLHAWRGGLPREVWFAEIEGLDKGLRSRLPHGEDAEKADEFFAALGRRLRGVGGGVSPPGLLAWYRFIAPRLRKGHESDPIVGVHFQRLYRAAFAGARTAPLLDGYDPALAADRDGDPEPLRLILAQSGAKLVLTRMNPGGGYQPTGSPLGWVETDAPEIKIEPLDNIPDRDLFWSTGEPPPWAYAWGWDDFGAWVEFAVEDRDGQRVSQRMRWIEPGIFLMGSPEDEAERYDDEGPQHQVRIEQGFWFFDTAVRQALWEAVTGDNPSRFKGTDRPVENVSWDDAQRFIAALNERLSGLDLGLPSEAEWEYACRAGTTTPFSFGENVTPAQVNYHGNYPYAGGEKGEYRAETVPVKRLPANPWGLYEMHGNVREWVQDTWHDNYEGAPTDGSAWEPDGAGADRVIRGGSWDINARNCRCAYRDRYEPVNRDDNLGFRCARVQNREPGKQEEGAERASLAQPGPRSGKGRAATESSRAAGNVAPSGDGVRDPVSTEAGLDSPSGPTLLRLGARESEAAAALPAAPALLIRTDREHLICRQITKPEWAFAIGRDLYGLWTEIAVEPERDEPVIQRMRWIPPGRFLMGSPQDEPGRWEAEGPQHQVTLTQGYWLFDSPCSQALWEALVGENPSRFKDRERPVEEVSWDDVQQRFLPALNERIPGFVLPSEAQWEYACRAGTETALYNGPIDILGRNNAPALDPIAWYGGNSGVDYELAEGHETTGELWKGMQYETKRAGTRKVKGKQPNPWGLYDMLGNVVEWVQDTWHDSYRGAPLDGSAWETGTTGADRVIRGGSWYGDAGYCRCAYRNRDEPDDRGDYLGFRCARVQDREPSK